MSEEVIRQIVQQITERIPVKMLLLLCVYEGERDVYSIETARTETDNHITLEAFLDCYDSMRHL